MFPEPSTRARTVMTILAGLAVAGAATSVAMFVALAGRAAPPVVAVPGLVAMPTADDWRAPMRTPNDAGVVALRSSTGVTCTAMPLRDTRLVVTSAHCLLDDRGNMPNQSLYVSVDGVEVDNPVRWAAIPPGYLADQSAQHDVAVLTTDHHWDVGADSVGPLEGPAVALHAYGMQWVDAAGNRLTPDDVQGWYQRIDACATEACTRSSTLPSVALTRCAVPAEVLRPSSDLVHAPCGLVHGASGGPVLATAADGSVRLVGVVVTASGDWRTNGFAAGSVVAELVNGGGLFVAVDAPGTDAPATAPPPRYTPVDRRLLERFLG